MGYQMCVVAVMVAVLHLAARGDALSCWKCSSQNDATCRDYFNTTRILLNQRQMDPYSYSNLQPATTAPRLEQCDGMHTSTYSQYKSVCLKRVLSVPNGPNEVHRECRMVHNDLKAGGCPEDILSNRPRNLEYCVTCDYDGCNSASSTTFVFVTLVPAFLLLLGQ